MATAFTVEQREEIQERLIAAARLRFSSTGMSGCTVDELTREAGISKGAFYHFFESKEHLFLRTLTSIQDEIYGRAEKVLLADEKRTIRERAMQAFYEVCTAADRYRLVWFFRRELPQLFAGMPEELLHKHYISDQERIRRLILKSNVSLTVELEEACSVLWLMVMSLVFKPDVGEGYFDALRIMVESVCDRILE